jgi:outer membrane murein-binding lipoprotein Lpp
MNARHVPALLAGALGLAAPAAGAATVEGLEAMLTQMQRQLDEARQEIQALKAENAQIRTQVEATGAAVERQTAAVERQSEAVAARGPSWADRTRLGAYGELHWNNTDNGSATQSEDNFDFHRFVLLLSHDFDARTRFFGEVELEHSLAGEGKPGEVELEQAFIERDFADRHAARAGLFLLPVGILNETHEPDTFYGVERNPIETRIIPTTWWEGGAGARGEVLPGLAYDLAVHTGLKVPTSGSGAYAIRSGRQKVANATGEDPAYTGRLRYSGVPGLTLATAVQYQEDIAQTTSSSTVDEAPAWLWEAHSVFERGPFGLRALYARWDIDGDEAEALGRDEQYGWYVEPSWRFTDAWGVFARYSRWDEIRGDSVDSRFEQWDVGLNYWLTEQVVLKLDYMNVKGPTDTTDAKGINAGVGFSFN